MIDNKTMHHTRAELQGTTQWFFSENATSAAAAILAGYLDMGNFLGFELKSDPKRTPTKSAARGVVFESGSTGAEVSLGIELQTKEVADMRKAKLALMGADAAPFTQAAIDNAAVDALAFTADMPAKLNRDYPLTNNGVLLRHLTAAVIQVGVTVLVEGTDYLLDKELAQVRFIKTATLPAAAVTVKVTAPLVDATSEKYMEGVTPMAQPVRRGYARFLIWDSNVGSRLVMDVEPRPVEIYTSGGWTVNAENQSEHKITAMFTSLAERALVRA